MAISVRDALRIRFAARRPSSAIVAVLALLMSVTGNAAAAVIISSNGQVAKATIAGHQPPTGDHPNIIPGSISAVDIAPGFRSSLRDKCPAGLQHNFGLCFDAAPNASAKWGDALQVCNTRFLRLPTPGEVALIYQATDALQDSQWTDALAFDGSIFVAATISQDTSRQLGFGVSALNNGTKYRCVIDATQ